MAKKEATERNWNKGSNIEFITDSGSARKGTKGWILEVVDDKITVLLNVHEPDGKFSDLKVETTKGEIDLLLKRVKGKPRSDFESLYLTKEEKKTALKEAASKKKNKQEITDL